MVEVPYYYSSSKGQWLRMEDMHKQHLINALCKFADQTIKLMEEERFRITLDIVVTDDNINVGWFIAESCLALGMVGTVTGFLYMLGTAFENIDISNTVTLQDALASMARGMSTALYTTLTGLIASLIIKVQLVNYEVEESV